MPELGADEEEGGGGVNQGVRVHTAHYGQNSFIAGHVRPAIKRPVRQGKLEEGEDVTNIRPFMRTVDPVLTLHQWDRRKCPYQ